MTALQGALKSWARRHIGVWPLFELRNRLQLGAALPRLNAFENAEVARLTVELGGRPKARVACIVPTYRRPEQVVEAVKSILAQDFEDFVIMVVDDGAGLPALPQDPRLTAVSLSRNSAVLGLVRNVGIRLTESDFLAFLDDDNTWTPRHLSLAIAELEKGGAEMVYMTIRRRTADGRELDIRSRPFERLSFINETNYVDSNSIVLRRTPRALFSRLPRVRATSPKEDWEFVYRMTGGARRPVAHVTTPTVEYLVNADSYYTDWSA